MTDFIFKEAPAHAIVIQLPDGATSTIFIPCPASETVRLSERCICPHCGAEHEVKS